MSLDDILSGAMPGPTAEAAPAEFSMPLQSMLPEEPPEIVESMVIHEEHALVTKMSSLFSIKQPTTAPEEQAPKQLSFFDRMKLAQEELQRNQQADKESSGGYTSSEESEESEESKESESD